MKRTRFEYRTAAVPEVSRSAAEWGKDFRVRFAISRARLRRLVLRTQSRSSHCADATNRGGRDAVQYSSRDGLPPRWPDHRPPIR
jgi:hypothetical protein